MVGRLRVWFSSDYPIRMQLSRLAGRVVGGTLVLAVLVSLFCYSGNPARCASETPRIRGTFVQLLSRHQEWKPDEWRRMFDEFSAMHISKIVVQWSVSGDLAFYSSKSFQSGPNPPLETILNLADAGGVQVSVGLWHDPDYWRNVTASASMVEVYLRRAKLRSTAIAAELAPSMARHPSFEGWYISEEIDDASWAEPARRKILKEHLESLSASLPKPAPNTGVSISCFSNARMDPGSLEGFWKYLLAGSSISRLLFQDGIGAHKLEFEYLPPFLSAMKRATAASGRGLSVVVEVFDQTAGPGRDGGSFAAVPAPLARIDRQISLAAEFGAQDIVAFSVPEYMTLAAGEASRRLKEAYMRKYIQGDLPRAATQPAALP